MSIEDPVKKREGGDQITPEQWGVLVARAEACRERVERMDIENASNSLRHVVQNLYNFGINVYLTKPVDEEQRASIYPNFNEAVLCLEKYLDLLDLYPEFKEAEMLSGQGYFPDLFVEHDHSQELVSAYTDALEKQHGVRQRERGPRGEMLRESHGLPIPPELAEQKRVFEELERKKLLSTSIRKSLQMVLDNNFGNESALRFKLDNALTREGFLSNKLSQRRFELTINSDLTSFTLVLFDGLEKEEYHFTESNGNGDVSEDDDNGDH